MNGDRGMASANALPRIRKHESDSYNSMGADSRYGSSRDHYVSFSPYSQLTLLTTWCPQSSRDDRRDRDRDHHRGDRRRSRSPRHRDRDSRRRDPDIDSYSSSRDYRAREREDRYGRESGHDDRTWDRDRGDRGGRGERDDRGMSRRDARRDDYDRPPRRDRDLFEGRMERDRGGGGRAPPRSDRDEFAMQMGSRKKSASPPPKKKEPTPDLTDTIPVTDRKRRLTQWDIKPPGYENVTAEQAKLSGKTWVYCPTTILLITSISGMFPLPGAPRQQPMDPSRLQAFMNQPSGSAGNAALKPSNARQSKRLFVHNVPSSATDESIVNFFNLQLNGLNVVSSPDPCISGQISKDRSFALLEFKNPSEATVALAFDGILMDDNENMETSNGISNGSSRGLSIRRPKDYIVPSIDLDEEYQEGIVSQVVPDTPNKISIANLLLTLVDEQVTELLVAFGQLKAFVLVKDSSTEESRVSCICL